MPNRLAVAVLALLTAVPALVALGADAAIANLVRLPAIARPVVDAAPPTARAPALTEDGYVAAILGRNLFDPARIDAGRPDERRLPTTELQLLGVLVAAPAEYSSALIGWVSSPDLPGSYSIGDRVRDRELVEIELDRIGLRKDGGPVEYLWLDGPGVTAGAAPDVGASGDVQQLGPNRFAVPRSLVDASLQDFEGLASLARVAPHRGPEGAPDGFRLSGIRADSLAGQLGIRNGDVVHSVNGLPLDSLPAAMSALETLRTGSSFCFALTRRGQPIEQCYEVR